jgi:hypothetical protein
VHSHDLFRETASLKRSVKKLKRREMSVESIPRTGCPESTPNNRCCVEATTTNYMTANGGARRGIASKKPQRIH